jgi:hypothetical protein
MHSRHIHVNLAECLLVRIHWIVDKMETDIRDGVIEMEQIIIHTDLETNHYTVEGHSFQWTPHDPFKLLHNSSLMMERIQVNL